MTKGSLRRISAAGAIASFAGTLLTLGLSNYPSGRPSFQLVLDFCFWASLALLLTSLVILFLVGAREGAEWVVVRFRPYVDVDYRPSRHDELKVIYKMAREAFGPQVSSLRRLQGWYSKNQEICWVVVVRRLSLHGGEMSERVAGYFMLIPIAPTAAARIEDSGIGDLIRLSEGDILGRNEAVRHVYIGAVYVRPELKNLLNGVGRSALCYLRSEVRRLQEAGVERFYARATSSRGVRLAQMHHFRPIDRADLEEGAICLLESTS